MEVINLVTGPTLSQRLNEIKTLSCAGNGIVSELASVAVLSSGQTDSQVVASRKNKVASRCRYLSITLLANRLLQQRIEVSQLVLTWVWWPNGETFASTCVQICDRTDFRIIPRFKELILPNT